MIVFGVELVPQRTEGHLAAVLQADFTGKGDYP